MASTAVKKPINNNQSAPSSSKGKVDSKSIVKRKIETTSKQQSVDVKNKSLPVKSAKSEEKRKTTTPATSTAKKVKREKKVYSLPGQKHDIPEEREPLRIFYESLSEQIPTSGMAEFWLMEHGMLSPERAKKAYEKKQRKQKQLRMGTPIKSPPPRSRPETSNRQKLSSSNNGEMKSKKIVAQDSDDEFIGSLKRRKV